MTGCQHPEGYTHDYSKAGAEVISRLAQGAIAHCGLLRRACRIDAVLGAIGSKSREQKAISNMTSSVVGIGVQAYTLVSLFFAS